MLYEFKFDFLRIICNHEHYIQLNLPMMRKQVKNFKGRFFFVALYFGNGMAIVSDSDLMVTVLSEVMCNWCGVYKY